MVKGIIENTHIISSKVTKFIWLLGYNNFSKMDMYFETEGVIFFFKINVKIWFYETTKGTSSILFVTGVWYAWCRRNHFIFEDQH